MYTVELTEGHRSGQTCLHCGEAADLGGWCGGCSINLRPDVPGRQSALAAATEHLWRSDLTLLGASTTASTAQALRLGGVSGAGQSLMDPINAVLDASYH